MMIFRTWPLGLAAACFAIFITACSHTPAALQPEAATQRYSFPPEWSEHEAMWLGWSDTPQHHPVQVAIVEALAPTVRIRLMVMSDEDRAAAHRALTDAGVPMERVEFVDQPVGNAWIRDAGPRFLSDGRSLAMADFAWNWYGYPEIMQRGWTTRAGIDDAVASSMDIPLVTSSIVSEGGGLDVSSSAILTYRDTALQRNPGVPLEHIEAEYLRVYGKKQVIWLSRSPLADSVRDRPKIENYIGWGANGHVDEFARFVNDSTIVVASVDPAEREWDPLTRADSEILAENLAELRAARDIDGQPFEIITLPTPALRHYVHTRAITEEDKAGPLGRAMLRDFEAGDEVNFVPALSYLNFVLSNGVVIVPAYWREGLPEREREKDEIARQTLQRLFPDRRVIQINPLPINWDGGGMHCMTQQQPRVAAGN